jgi:hypothetical protein
MIEKILRENERRITYICFYSYNLYLVIQLVIAITKNKMSCRIIIKKKERVNERKEREMLFDRTISCSCN